MAEENGRCRCPARFPSRWPYECSFCSGRVEPDLIDLAILDYVAGRPLKGGVLIARDETRPDATVERLGERMAQRWPDVIVQDVEAS